MYDFDIVDQENSKEIQHVKLFLSVTKHERGYGLEHAVDIATDAVSAISLGGENMSLWV
jgi:hypothetical protein